MLFLTANIFQPLIDIFDPILVFFHNHLGVSWGLAIVLLTVCVRALLLPLTIKQFHSMQKLQAVAPQLKEIQNKYKDDKQRQQQEIMKFYRENDVNPFASCLPLAAQIPVFIGLFYTLRTSLRKDICPSVQHAYQATIAHHLSVHAAAGQTTYCTNPAYAHFYHGGAGFLFIPDLTNTAHGLVLIVLIVLYVGTQLASSLMMATPTMDQTQRRIMLLLPLFFVVFIINFPAGLILYWITTNAWTMGQQYLIKKRLGPVVPPAPVASTATRATSTAGAEDGAASGGLGGLVRGLRKPVETKAKEKQPAGVGARSGPRPRRETPPPPPPRKKKKRSGRRR